MHFAHGDISQHVLHSFLSPECSPAPLFFVFATEVSHGHSMPQLSHCSVCFPCPNCGEVGRPPTQTADERSTAVQRAFFPPHVLYFRNPRRSSLLPCQAEPRWAFASRRDLWKFLPLMRPSTTRTRCQNSPRRDMPQHAAEGFLGRSVQIGVGMTLLWLSSCCISKIERKSYSRHGACHCS